MGRQYPGAAQVTEDELLAIAVGAGLLPQPAVPDPSDVAGLLPTPDERVWFNPATGSRVRVPAGAHTTDDVVVTTQED